MSTATVDNAMQSSSLDSLLDIERAAQGTSDLALAVPTQAAAVHELLNAEQSGRHGDGGIFKCIPFNDNIVFWQQFCWSLCL